MEYISAHDRKGLYQNYTLHTPQKSNQIDVFFYFFSVDCVLKRQMKYVVILVDYYYETCFDLVQHLKHYVLFIIIFTKSKLIL